MHDSQDKLWRQSSTAKTFDNKPIQRIYVETPLEIV